MAKRDQGYMAQLRDRQAEPSRHRESHEERRTVLYLAVVGTMAFIVAMWFMIMPVQMTNIRISGMKRVIDSPADAKTASEQWDDLMGGASSRLQQTSDAIAAKEALITAAPAPAPIIDAAAIAAKLEAANAVASAPAPAPTPAPASATTPSR